MFNAVRLFFCVACALLNCFSTLDAANIVNTNIAELIQNAQFSQLRSLVCYPLAEDSLVAVQLQRPFLEMFAEIRTSKQYFIFVASAHKHQIADGQEEMLPICMLCQQHFDENEVLSTLDPIPEKNLHFTAGNINKKHLMHIDCMNALELGAKCPNCRQGDLYSPAEMMFYFNRKTFARLNTCQKLTFTKEFNDVEAMEKFCTDFFNFFFNQIDLPNDEYVLTKTAFFSSLVHVSNFIECNSNVSFDRVFFLRQFNSILNAPFLADFCEFLLANHRQFLYDVASVYNSVESAKLRQFCLTFFTFVTQNSRIINGLSIDFQFAVRSALAEQQHATSPDHWIKALENLGPMACEASQSPHPCLMSFLVSFVRNFVQNNANAHCILRQNDFNFDTITLDQFDMIVNGLEMKNTLFVPNAVFLISKAKNTSTQMQIVIRLFDKLLTPEKTMEILCASEELLRNAHELIIDRMESANILHILKGVEFKVEFDESFQHLFFDAACRKRNISVLEYLMNDACLKKRKTLLQLYLCDLLDNAYYDTFERYISQLDAKSVNPGLLIQSKGFSTASMELKEKIVNAFLCNAQRSTSVLLYLVAFADSLVKLDSAKRKAIFPTFNENCNKLAKYLAKEDAEILNTIRQVAH